MSKPVFLKFFAFLSLILLAACSGSSSSPNQPVDVQITLTDFAIQSSLTNFQVGVPYHFTVTNNGAVAHELMLMEPVEGGAMDMEAMDSMALAHVDEDDLQPGSTQTFDYTFTQAYSAGQLEFACHITGHYEAGMVLPITVE